MNREKSPSGEHMSQILVYADEGAWFGPLARSLVREADPARHVVRLVGAAHILEDAGLFDRAALFVMPGGADRPYCRALDGAGNAAIRGFVEQGGAYLGICAGGYYASRHIRFEGASPRIIDEPRELALFAGRAIGSIAAFGRLYDMTKRSAATPALRTGDGGVFHAYYNGGPYYVPDAGAHAEILAHYADLPQEQSAAIVETRVGAGRALLAGVHLEVSAAELAEDLMSLTDAEAYRHLVETLRKTEPARRDFWRGLLSRCGLALAEQSAARAA